MEYMLMSFETSDDFALRTNEKEMEQYWGKWANYFNEMEAAKILTNQGNILHSGEDALTIHSDTAPSNSSFTEANKQLSGFWVINVVDRDTAIYWARQAPVSKEGAVEIRPVWQ